MIYIVLTLPSLINCALKCAPNLNWQIYIVISISHRQHDQLDLPPKGDAEGPDGSRGRVTDRVLKPDGWRGLTFNFL